MRVLLTRRLAECLDGIDVSQRHVGEVLDLSPHDAEMLMAEGWATAVPSERTDAIDRETGAPVADGPRQSG